MDTHSSAYQPPSPEADGNYKYYLIGNVKPVRILLDEKGRMCGAESLDLRTPNKLNVDHLRMLTVMKGETDVEEITKTEFIDCCRRARYESEPFKPPPDLYRNTEGYDAEETFELRKHRERRFVLNIMDEIEAAERAGRPDDVARLHLHLTMARAYFNL